jgi:zinc transporter, ZIP family
MSVITSIKRNQDLSDIAMIILMTTMAGACMPFGGWLARFENIRSGWLENEFRHFVIAFGGGLLMGAVFEMLLPQGLKMVDNIYIAVATFAGGGILFFALEKYLGLKKKAAPQLTGMLVDFVPESIALGGLAASQPRMAWGMAVVIGLQNIPEGFNAYRELADTNKTKSKKALQFMMWLVPTGPAAGLLAHFWLSNHPSLLGSIMLTAAGGIVYLMFQEIGPQSRLEHHWGPPLGAVLGVAVTLLTDEWASA